MRVPELTPRVVGCNARNLTRCLLLTGVVAAGCGQGTVSNDDSVSRAAAERAVERFFGQIHDGRYAAACAPLPARQRAGLARLSAARGAAASCEAALRTLREFAPARSPRRLTFRHDIGFRGSLPHRSKAAVDDVAIDGRSVGAVGLRRDGDTWSVVVVCEC